MVPMVERVNQELPGLLVEWRRGIQGELETCCAHS